MNSFNTNDHRRTIIHIDMDCFYAQVEMVKNPELINKPLGIQQKNIVVTCNYLAREAGVKKLMLINEAQKVCPSLVLVNGEDLHDYRQISYKITSYLQQVTPFVERLGLDENYMDVTVLVNERLKQNIDDLSISGHVFGDIDDKCECGCFERLTIGSNIAEEIRNGIKLNFKLTSCAGIAHNKLLSKIVGSKHKPNQQTILYPNNTLELMNSIEKIPGIGRVMQGIMNKEGLKIVDLQNNYNLVRLKKIFGDEKGQLIHNLSLGIDESLVKPSGKPQSIGLEDSFKKITAITEVREKFTLLLSRLMILVSEDGRIPRTIKITVRIFDTLKKISHKETKQTNVNPSLFKTIDGKITLGPSSNEKLIEIIINLVKKIIFTHQNKHYNITLLGLSFTKFLEKQKTSLTTFLRKNVQVESVTNIEHLNTSDCTPMETTQDVCESDGSESDLGSSPKKKKIKPGIIDMKRRCFNEDLPSPSKLKVASLHLNDNDTPTTSVGDVKRVRCPPNANEDVFKALPEDIQKELWMDYTITNNNNNKRFKIQNGTKPKANTLLNYFVKN